jgi:hypothetical protein
MRMIDRALSKGSCHFARCPARRKPEKDRRAQSEQHRLSARLAHTPRSAKQQCKWNEWTGGRNSQRARASGNTPLAEMFSVSEPML